jgi:uncharacterized protein YkwD/uncharacterized membrane protein required for colicin V production
VPSNWVDIAVLCVIAWHIAGGVRRGFVLSIVDLVRFILALIVPLALYVQVGGWASEQWSIPNLLAQPLAFTVLWAATSIIVGVAGRFIGAPFAALLRGSSLDLILSLAPSAVKGLAAAGVLLTVVVSVPPLSPGIPGSRPVALLREAIDESALAPFLIERTAAFDRLGRELVGESLMETLTLLTVKPEARERIDLKFTVELPAVDSSAEAQMLDLLNLERVRHGLKPLVRDPTLDEVARAHSIEMLQQGYFSHVTPEGKNPFDRMRAAGVRFTVGGENLALAPTVALAHQGLMDSSGHRANILGPEYTRVGIGATRADGRGRMFTQSFAD